MWNDFIATAKNATFLHNRDFMDYHSERFQDYSLLIYKAEKLVAVLPANRVGDTLYSHQGLTYGGLIVAQKLKLKDYILLVQELLHFLEKQGILILAVKEMPEFYATYPSQELGYVAQLAKAIITRVDTAAVIDYNNKLPIQSNRLEGLKKAQKQGLMLKEETEFDAFWKYILLPNLAARHDALPTHTLEEIKKLHAKFPENIRQYNVYNKDKIVAGATLFVTQTTAHVQYISANEQKQELGSLDFLFEQLINRTFAHKHYFDFGISNENKGMKLNGGLSYWKECFGARTKLHRFYSFNTANHGLLKNVVL